MLARRFALLFAPRITLTTQRFCALTPTIAACHVLPRDRHACHRTLLATSPSATTAAKTSFRTRSSNLAKATARTVAQLVTTATTSFEKSESRERVFFVLLFLLINCVCDLFVTCDLLVSSLELGIYIAHRKQYSSLHFLLTCTYLLTSHNYA